MNRVAFGGIFVALSVATSLGVAEVRHDGTWPSTEKTVSLKLQHVPRAEAVRKLADLAGWSVVIHAPEGDAVDVSVKDQPPSKVLDLLLDDREYVAKRDGSLISIDFDGASDSLAVPPIPPMPAIPPIPPMAMPGSTAAPPPPDDDQDETDSPPAADASADAKGASKPPREHPTTRGKDRGATGSNLKIDKAEVAHDVAVMGGNVDVYGTVTGDVSVTGGNLHVHEGGWILGDAVVIGGVLTVDDDGQVDGDVSTLGGSIRRSDKAVIGGSIESRGDDNSDEEDEDEDAKKTPAGHHGPTIHIERNHKAHVTSFLSDLGGGLAHSAMLFVFGSVLLALASRRMETLRVEAASKPMRSFAVGVVGSLVALVLFIACCVTLIGIPVAIIGLLLLVFGAYAGVCAVLTVVGQALLRHKTKSPYVHLAVGCAIFMVLGALPYVGGFFVAATALVGIGVLVATRAAGLVKAKNGARPMDTTYGDASAV
jgi:hypothetical protein